MGGLPLALDQAGAYVEETGCKLADYQQRYQQQRALLLARRGTPAGHHPHSVTATFTLAFQRLAREQPIAAEILQVCAFLHAEDIPEELFLTGASHLGPVLAPLADDPYQLDLALATLRASALIQRQSENRTLSLHRLVQAVLQAMMSEQERARWRQHVIRALDALFPESNHEVWKKCERLLSHILIYATVAPEQTVHQDLARMLMKAANYLREHAQYEQAEPLYRRVLHIREQIFGFDHPQAAITMNNLAILYTSWGKYEQAEPLYQRALRIEEQALGPEHLTVTNPLNNLANLYQELGKYEQAEPLYRRVLCIREQALGSEHLRLANPLNNLARLYQELGKYEQAEPLFWRAFYIREQANDPEMARPLYNLAKLYQQQGKYEQAAVFYQRSHLLWEQTLGPNHPDVAYPLNGLANLSCNQGKYEQAMLLYQRVLNIREHYLGARHPDTAQTSHDFALCLQRQEKFAEAEGYLQRALEIRAQALGDAHPYTIATRTAYAALLRAMGCGDEARPENTNSEPQGAGETLA